MGELHTEQRGRVVVATLANPPHALFDADLVTALDGLVTSTARDPSVGAVVLTGAHPSRFLAHYDIGELLGGAQAGPAVGRRAAGAALGVVGALRRVPRVAEALEGTPAAGLAALERFHATLLAMNRSGVVFVAALNGSAMGGACELALACDVRLMADGAGHALGQPEVLFGFPPGGGATQRLTRMLGTTRTLRLVLEGAPLTPEEAERLGIVDEVVDSGGLLDRASALAAHLGARPKGAVQAAKRAIYEGASLPLAAGLHVERAELLAAIGSPDAVAAMQAYQSRLEQTGELPAYDGTSLADAVQRGRFA